VTPFGRLVVWSLVIVVALAGLALYTRVFT
jgi:hypothetical protein